jgi:serine/threonine protein kinase
MQGQVLLGKYRIVRQLDEGGMSKIYLANQVDLKREAVVKVLRDELANQTKPLAHFRREIYITSRFRHANAVTYFDSSLTERCGPVLVMEYLRGLDLGLLLQREGRLNPERVGRLLGQLCDVLQAAHAAGIIHRDIKPGNLMIVYPGTPHETIKLMDFGLAKMSSLLYIGADELFDFTLPPAAGTPEYIAPEQVRTQDMDHRGDLYSVGVVLYELMTGRRPFSSESAEDLLQAHLEAEPPSFARWGAGYISAAVEGVVRRCLAKCPDDRPQNAAELAEAFERALGRRITSARAGALPPVSPSTGRPTTPPPTETAPQRAADRLAMQQSFEANMPESMAMLKVKGFICDLGGEVVESSPGLIRVRLEDPAAVAARKKKSGLFSWGERGRQVAVLQTTTATDLELHMERKDPAQANRLTITLILRPGVGLVTAEWRRRCNQIGLDLKAYLMGR